MHAVEPARPRSPHKGAPLEAFSRTEKIIAFCRVLLALATAAIVIVDPKQPSYAPDVALVVLGAYLVYSVVVFALVRGEHVRQERVGAFSAAADIVWVTVITLFTERGASPFFMLHIFVISSVSVRWGLAATIRVTLLLALLYPAMMWVASNTIDDDLVLHRAHLVRPIYLLVIGYLIGYLGEHERRSKRKLGLLLDLTSVVRRSPPTGRTLAQLMRRALH